jgi:hypothetical protein
MYTVVIVADVDATVGRDGHLVWSAADRDGIDDLVGEGVDNRHGAVPAVGHEEHLPLMVVRDPCNP